MRHNTFGRKLGRTTSHRLAMFRNQLASLVESERIVTTLPKAKELRPIAERAITQGKRGTVHARRLVARWLTSRPLVKKLFEEIAPRFAERPGGYLRIVKLGNRAGDGAEMAVLEFVDFELKKKTAAKGKADEKKGKAAKGESKAAAPAEGEAEKETKPAKPAKKAAAKPAVKKAAAPKAEAKPAKGKAPAPKKGSTPKKIGS